MGRVVAMMLLGAALAGCPSPELACRVGADCASGVCLRDGTCQAPVTPVDGGGVAVDAGPGADGGSIDADGGAPDSGTPALCVPNGDGVISREEIVVRPGLHATFRVSGAATFATAGAAQADGGRTWDFTPALSGDQSQLVETLSMQGQWFESTFPDAGYASPLGQGSDLLGIYQLTPTALLLHGVASPAAGASATKLVYTPPVEVLRFPLRQTDTWSTSSDVSGTYQGLVIGFNLPLQNDTFRVTVDRAGDAITPYSRFGVLRVRTVMERTLNFVPSPLQTVRSYAFVAECFGAVATVTSTDGETSTEFTAAKEVRRLTP